MTSDVYVVKCAKCGGELTHKCTLDDKGLLRIEVSACPECAKDDYVGRYREGYDEGYMDGCTDAYDDIGDLWIEISDMAKKSAEKDLTC